MAAMVSEVNGAENDLNNAKHPSLVILDSDEEEEQTTSELFQGFIKAVQPFLERKEILLLRVKFAEIRPEYASSTTFRELLRRKASQVHKTDVYIHFNEILQTLISNAALYGRNALKPNREDEVKSIGESTSDANTEETTMAGKFETDRQCAYRVTSKPGTSAQSDRSIQIEIQIVDLDDQPNSQEFNSQKHPVRHMSKDDQEENIRKQNRKKKIMKLERKLKHISSEIKRLTQSELSLEEMELADSNYMKESRLKEQFNKVWEKICLLKGRPPDTGRVVEQEVKVKGTNFPAIDKAVRKFLKKKKGFPNIFDVRNIVIKANKKCGLGLTPSVVQEIAADVFTDIGNKIQKKRKKDYEYNFGCHLTDDCLSSLDPALNDYDLRKKLDENKKVGQNALEGIFQKYVHLGRIKGQENYDSTPCNTDYESSDDETHVRKKAKKRKTDSSDSSGSDPERKVKQAKHRQQQAATITSNSEVNVPEVKPTSRNRNLEKASCSGFSQSTLTTSKYESIEIIDDDDDDDDNITAVSSQKFISENTKTACPDKPLNQTSSTSNTNESFKNLETSSLNHIGESKSLSNGISESLPAPTKPNNDINESVNHENLSNDPGKPLNHSNLSNGLNESVNDDQNMDSEVSATDNNKYVINRIPKHKEQPHDTQISEDSLVEMSDSSVVCLDTSLKINNSIPSTKPQLNTSKLHLKILQLRDQKLSDLNKISDVNPKSEGQTSLTNSVMSESRCHKRKSTAPHHIHVNGCTPSPSTDSPAMQHGKNTKYPKISDSPGVTKPSSTPVTMIQNCNAGSKQHFDAVRDLPLKDQNSCAQTQDTRRTAKCSLIESPAQSVTTKMPSYSRSPSNSAQSIQSDSNKYSSTNATSNSILSGNSPQLKKSLRNDTASSKTSAIIILSDDED